MGITISSKNNGCDMGYFGFRRFRVLVAEKVNCEVGNHYKHLENAPFFGDIKDWFAKYDEKTETLIQDKKLSSEVANFLYQSDCEGKINKTQAKLIYNLIKDEDDDIIFGYVGRPDCAKMKHLKDIFNDNSKVKWF